MKIKIRIVIYQDQIRLEMAGIMISVSEGSESREPKERNSRRIKEEQLKISYQLAEQEFGNNEQGLERAYDILFEEVLKDREKKKSTVGTRHL